MLSVAIRQARRPVLRRAGSIRAPITSQWSRGYAKDRRSRHNHKADSTFKSNHQQGQPPKRNDAPRSNEPVAFHIRDTSKPQNPELSRAPRGLNEDLLSDSDVTASRGKEAIKSGEKHPGPRTESQPAAFDPSGVDENAETPDTTRPLPDLTQGIPSTLEYEGTQSQKGASLVGLNLTEDPAQPATGGGRDGGDLPKSAYVSSLERRRQRLVRYMLVSLALMAVTGSVYLGRNWDTEEEEKQFIEAPSGWGFGLFYRRAKARLNALTDWFTEPAFPKLLPDPDPQWARTHTLVISLEDMLLHSEWSREHGWRMAKRPGVDYFLRYLSQYYELVIWSSVPWAIGDPIVRKFDPFRIVTWPLFREATRYVNGDHVKVSSVSIST
jgi:import inner membrane translocase subunit TIM50